MNKSKFYEKVKDYFDKKLWNKKRVADAVKKGKITAEEYKEITGESL